MWSVHTHTGKKKESFGLSREDGVYYKGRVVWGREGAEISAVEDVLSSGCIRCEAQVQGRPSERGVWSSGKGEG